MREKYLNNLIRIYCKHSRPLPYYYRIGTESDPALSPDPANPDGMVWTGVCVIGGSNCSIVWGTNERNIIYPPGIKFEIILTLLA